MEAGHCPFWEIQVISAHWEEQFHLLEYWENAPHARYCHPREEHLMPLQLCPGMADGKAELIFDDSILGKRAVAFRW